MTKSFIIQAFIALIIFATLLTPSVNAATVSPARFAHQDNERRAALPAPEKRVWFAREAYESLAALPGSVTDIVPALVARDDGSARNTLAAIVCFMNPVCDAMVGIKEIKKQD